MPKLRALPRAVTNWLSGLLLVFLFLCALAPLVEADRLALGMLFTYPPRVLLLLVGVALALVYLLRRRWLGALSSIAISVLIGANLEWGGGLKTQAERHANEFSLLAFNVHDRVDRAADLAALTESRGIDFLLLQEVKPDVFGDFQEALRDYRLYTGDRSKRFKHDDWGPFSSVIGIHRRHPGEATVDTAITGYRTFALNIDLGGVRLTLINVHSTKAFWTGGSWYEPITRMGYKAKWHLEENQLLNAWIARHSDHPIVVAGDFNAPFGAAGRRLAGLHSAHAASGSGLNLSFPRKQPVWDIDHTLGNDRIRFLGYTNEDLGFSDHRAQLVRFAIIPN
jgi:endonuclease/exonuclease/phosphatase (EEP) superfamily protein YafD